MSARKHWPLLIPSASFQAAYRRDPGRVWAGVIFDTLNNVGAVSYTLRLKPSGDYSKDGHEWWPTVPLGDSLYDTSNSCRGNWSSGGCASQRYIQSGFLFLQRQIDVQIARLRNVTLSPAPVLEVREMPLASDELNPTSALRSIFAMMATMSFLYLVQFLLSTLVTEKERGIKEGLYLMGMHRMAYWASWFITHAMMAVVTVAIMTALGKAIIFRNSDAILFFVLLLAYGLSMIVMAFAFTPFFTNGKMAGVAGTAASLVFSALPYGLTYIKSPPLKWAMSLMSPCAAAFAFTDVVALDQQGGMNPSNFSRGAYSPLSALIMMLVDTVSGRSFVLCYSFCNRRMQLFGTLFSHTQWEGVCGQTRGGGL